MRLSMKATALAALAAIPPLSAAAVTMHNGGFEGPEVGGSFDTYGAGSGRLTGWTVGGHGIDHIGTYWSAAGGAQSLDLSGPGAGTISQDVTGLTVGTSYLLGFMLAGNPAGGDSMKSLDVALDGRTAGSFTFGTSGRTLTNMGWTAESLIFTATSNTMTLSFASNSNSAYGPALDSVTVAAVPLPAALPLLAGGLGLMGLVGWRRRR